MLYGERPYVDFFQFTAPGTDVLYFSLLRLCGVHVVLPNIVDIALGVALCMVCFSVAIQLMSGRSAWLATLLFVTLVYGSLINGTHHLFSVLLIMAGLAVIMRGRSLTRSAITGALLATASFFTQTHGAVSMLALILWLIWEGHVANRGWRQILLTLTVVGVAYLATLAVIYLYFIVTVGLHQLWYFQVTYVYRYMGSAASVVPMWPLAFSWRRLPVFGQYVFVCLGLPLIYPVSLVLWWRSRRHRASIEDTRIILLSLVGVALFAEVALCPSWLRYYTVAMPGIILLIWVIGKSGRAGNVILSLTWVGVIYFAGQQMYVRHAKHYVVANLPAGRAAVPIETYEKLSLLSKLTRPGDFFFEAIWPGLYFPLGLHNPAYIDTVGTDNSCRPEYVERAIVDLELKRVQYVLWAPFLERAEPGDDRSYHLAHLRNYLHARYERVQTLVDEEELWQRRR